MSTTIIKGSELQLFYNNEAFAWATSHTLTLTGNSTEVSTKDHGLYASNEIGSLSWEITSENLYSDDDYDTLFDLWTQAAPITVAFAKVSNFSTSGLERVGGDVLAWEPDMENYRSGQAVITSLTVNANAGENATYSITLTGAGPLTKYSNV